MAPNSELPLVRLLCMTCGELISTTAGAGKSVRCNGSPGCTGQRGVPGSRPVTAGQAENWTDPAILRDRRRPARADTVAAAAADPWWEAEPEWDGVPATVRGDPCDVCETPLIWEARRTTVVCMTCHVIGLPPAVGEAYASRTARAEVALVPRASRAEGLAASMDFAVERDRVRRGLERMRADKRMTPESDARLAFLIGEVARAATPGHLAELVDLAEGTTFKRRHWGAGRLEAVPDDYEDDYEDDDATDRAPLAITAGNRGEPRMPDALRALGWWMTPRAGDTCQVNDPAQCCATNTQALGQGFYACGWHYDQLRKTLKQLRQETA